MPCLVEPYFLSCQPGFLQPVQLPVPGQQQGGPVADFQILRRNGHAGGADGVHLTEQVLAVQRHAVAQNVHHALPENAGGQQMQGKGALFIDHGVAGVAAALIPHHHVIVVGKIVHHAALAFVAPVNTYNCTVCHYLQPPGMSVRFRTVH